MKKILLLSLIAIGFFLFSDAQNVGIGTAVPQSKLHIKGSADTSQFIIDANSTQSASHPLIRLRDASGNDLLHISSNNSSNSFIGFKAGITGGGTLNTLIGSNAGYFNMADKITAIGSSALYNNTSGTENAALGAYSLFSNTTGRYNTGIGIYALNANNTGGYNTATGERSLYFNASGSANTANGAAALFTNSTGNYNTASGFQSLSANLIGSENTAMGAYSLGNSSGTLTNYNTAIGANTLFNTINPQYNTAVGYNAGSGNDNSSNNVFVGANADVNGAGYFNVIAIGSGAVCTASEQVTLGSGANVSYRAYANWTNISDGRYKKNVQENVPGLAFINQLRPVTYNLDATGLDAFLHKNSGQATQRIGASKNNAVTMLPNDDAGKAEYLQALKEKETIVYTGFVAQEVETTAKKLGFNFSGVDAPKNENDVYGLRYAEFVVPLVKAIQEQQQMISEMQKRIQVLEEQNKLLQQLINK